MALVLPGYYTPPLHIILLQPFHQHLNIFPWQRIRHKLILRVIDPRDTELLLTGHHTVLIVVDHCPVFDFPIQIEPGLLTFCLLNKVKGIQNRDSQSGVLFISLSETNLVEEFK